MGAIGNSSLRQKPGQSIWQSKRVWLLLLVLAALIVFPKLWLLALAAGVIFLVGLIVLDVLGGPALYGAALGRFVGWVMRISRAK